MLFDSKFDAGIEFGFQRGVGLDGLLQGRKDFFGRGFHR
jgi:hypothetical protein